MQEGAVVPRGRRRRREGEGVAAQARERQGLVEGGREGGARGPGGDENRRVGRREGEGGEPGEGGQRDGLREQERGVFQVRPGGRRRRGGRRGLRGGGRRRPRLRVLGQERRRKGAQRKSRRCDSRDPRKSPGRFRQRHAGLVARLRVRRVRPRTRVPRGHLRNFRIDRGGGGNIGERRGRGAGGGEEVGHARGRREAPLPEPRKRAGGRRPKGEGDLRGEDEGREQAAGDSGEDRERANEEVLRGGLPHGTGAHGGGGQSQGVEGPEWAGAGGEGVPVDGDGQVVVHVMRVVR
mmetsp:Transcript_52326/g.111196  ORF Transcript_52326/g.111196 Transcript_52326/m.111196 type:complete len:294 (-) Transcript_52326:254-1135(-)